MFVMKTLKLVYQCDQDILCCKAGKWNFNTPLEDFFQKQLKKEKMVLYVKIKVNIKNIFLVASLVHGRKQSKSEKS